MTDCLNTLQVSVSRQRRQPSVCAFCRVFPHPTVSCARPQSCGAHPTKPPVYRTFPAAARQAFRSSPLSGRACRPCSWDSPERSYLLRAPVFHLLYALPPLPFCGQQTPMHLPAWYLSYPRQLSRYGHRRNLLQVSSYQSPLLIIHILPLRGKQHTYSG